MIDWTHFSMDDSKLLTRGDSMTATVTDTQNVLIVGVGGQGVLRCSQVLSDAMVRQGCDVKQSEVHGMSQRGGSVVSEVRFGRKVYSPLSPLADADYIVALEDDEGKRSEHRLADDGVYVGVPQDLRAELFDPRAANMAALGRLSGYLDVPEDIWHEAIRKCMPPKTIEGNIAAFEAGSNYDS
jgi:indolepyruvate ferredoxin oxidoreductase beta subunit